MRRFSIVVVMALLGFLPAHGTPRLAPDRKDRERAFERLRQAGAHLMIRQAGCLLTITERTTPLDYQNMASASGVYDGQIPACQPVVALSFSDRLCKSSKFTDAALLAASCFPEVRKLSIEGSRVTNAGMAHLYALRGLRELRLWRVRVSDDGLRCLNAMSHLRLLQLMGNRRITGSCLRYLPHASEVEEIDLEGGPRLVSQNLRFVGRLAAIRRLNWQCFAFHEADLANLVATPRLESLAIQTYESRITDAGLKQVARLTTLRTLVLGRTKISPRGIAYLRTLLRLRALTLSNNDLGDAELAALGKLKRLELLQLDYTKISDTGLKSLYSMKTLKEISLRGTAVTRNGLRALRAARPDLKIWWGGDGAPFPGQIRPPAGSGQHATGGTAATQPRAGQP